MKITPVSTTLILSMVLSLSARILVTPVFVHKDGEASLTTGYNGSQKDILVSGADNSVGWMTFQTQGIEFSTTAKATLSLYLKAMKAAGTLKVYALDSALNLAEDNVKYADLRFSTSAPLASVSLFTSDVEKVLQIDVTSAVKSGKFNGIALVSSDLEATFDSKEGNLKPVIMLSYNDVTAAWADSVGYVRTNGKIGVGKYPAMSIDVKGTVAADSFAGDGSALTNVRVPSGTITDAQIASGAAIAYSKISGSPTTLPPSGAAGGSLAGSYPNPTLAANSVGPSEIADGAVTFAKLAPAFGLSYNSWELGANDGQGAGIDLHGATAALNGGNFAARIYRQPGDGGDLEISNLGGAIHIDAPGLIYLKGLTIFAKGGNNGSTNALNFCAGAQWGPTGYGIASRIASGPLAGTYIAADQGSAYDLTCICVSVQ